MTAHPEDKNLASILNDFRRRLFELERRTLRLPDSAGPLETFDNGTPIGETRFLDFGVGLTATRIGDDFVQVNGADATTEFDAIVDPSLAQDDPSARLFTTPGRAGDYLRNTVGLTERANIFVRRRSPSAASPDAFIETASYTFPDHVFLWCQPSDTNFQNTGQEVDVTWDHNNFTMTAVTWDIYGMAIDPGTTKSTIFTGRVRLTDCKLLQSNGGTNVGQVGSSGGTVLIRCWMTDQWYRFAEAYNCQFRIYTPGTYNPSDGTRFVMDLCYLDAGTLQDDPVTWSLPVDTLMRIQEVSGGTGGTVTFSCASTDGEYYIESRCNNTAVINVTNAVNARRIQLQGQFQSVTVAAPAADDRAHSLDIACTALDVTGPALLDAKVYSGTVTIRGDRVSGHIIGRRLASSGAWLNFVSTTRSRIDAACVPTGGSSGTYQPWTMNSGCVRNMLTFAGASEFPAVGTDAGTRNMITET